MKPSNLYPIYQNLLKRLDSINRSKELSSQVPSTQNQVAKKSQRMALHKKLASGAETPAGLPAGGRRRVVRQSLTLLRPEHVPAHKLLRQHSCPFVSIRGSRFPPDYNQMLWISPSENFSSISQK